MQATQQTIKKITKHLTHVEFEFESGFCSNDQRRFLADKFEEGETILFQSGRNRYRSEYFKLT